MLRALHCIFRQARMARATREIAMVPLHDLLSRINWDPEFGRGEFRIGYHDNILGELAYVPLPEVRQEEGDHCCF